MAGIQLITVYEGLAGTLAPALVIDARVKLVNEQTNECSKSGANSIVLSPRD